MTIDTLWYTRCPAPTAASVAIRQGWLEAEFVPDGIAVTSLAASPDRSVHLSHYRHTQPNSFRFGGWVPPLIARSQGSDVRVVGLNWHDRVGGFHALPDGPVRSVADLRGARVAIPRRVNDTIDWWRASVLAAWEALLAATGLTLHDIEPVEIAIERQYVEDATAGEGAGQSLWGARSQFAVQREEIVALHRGEVDLVYSDGAMGAILRAVTGARLVFAFDPAEDAPQPNFGHPTVLTASGRLIDERPDLVARWIERLLDAPAWGASHRDEARRLFAVDTGLPEDFVDEAYSPRLALQLDISLSPSRIERLRHCYDLLLRHHFLDAPFDFDAFIDPSPLAAALRARAAAAPVHATVR